MAFSLPKLVQLDGVQELHPTDSLPRPASLLGLRSISDGYSKCPPMVVGVQVLGASEKDFLATPKKHLPKLQRPAQRQGFVSDDLLRVKQFKQSETP